MIMAKNGIGIIVINDNFQSTTKNIINKVIKPCESESTSVKIPPAATIRIAPKSLVVRAIKSPVRYLWKKSLSIRIK